MSVEIDFGSVNRAATTWADQADELARASRRLHAADPGRLSERVRSSARTWLDFWATEVTTLATSAEDHSQALRDAVVTWATIDEREKRKLGGLLPHVPDGAA